MKHIKTIAVIGAGIIGVTTAFMLVRTGYKVILIDSAEGPALGTSFANGAQLSYSYTDAMASPTLLKKMPGILSGRDPAFRISCSQDPRILNWGSRFLLNGRSAKEVNNTSTILRLSLHSRAVLHELMQTHSLCFEHRQSGKLHIYSATADMEKAARRVEQKNQWGCPQELLDRQACIALEPALAQLQGEFVGGVYSPLDEVGDAPAFARALLAVMRSTGLLEEHYRTRVVRLATSKRHIDALETSQGRIEADGYVLATGPGSLELSHQLGLKLPIYPIKGYSVTVPATTQAPDICITDVSNKVVFARLGDRLRIAGCADIVGFDTRLDHKRLDYLLDVCRRRFPRAGRYREIQHEWTGMRPVTPSSAPIIGLAGADNLYLNIGHGMLGWTLAMGSASVLAAQVSQLPEPIDTRGFRPIDHGLG